MAVYEYADQFERQLAQKYERELVSYELTQSNPGIKFMNAQTIKIPRLTVSGYKDHNRTNMGFNTGTVSNDWEPKKLTHDRDIEFAIDPMDGKIHPLRFFCFMHVFRVFLKVRKRPLQLMVQGMLKLLSMWFFQIFPVELRCVRCCVQLIPSASLKK